MGQDRFPPPDLRIPSKMFVVNESTYTPLPAEERQRQVQEIARKNVEANRYIATLNTPESHLDALARCMDPYTGFEFWCDHFAYTNAVFDTRQPHKRFILYDYQRAAARKIIESIRVGRNVLMDKSRDMGASWLMLAVITWCWLFDESFHALVGSRKEDLVDMGTIDDLYGKMDYMIDRLPLWMKNGYDRGNRLHRKTMFMKHPVTGNLITGESANTNFGRGPRKNVVLMDEYAFWDADRTVWDAVADTAPCKLVTSTPFGMGNKFAELRFSENPELLIITLHWTLHPRKDEAWYEDQCNKRKGSKIAIAQELDIDYKASAGGLALPLFQKYQSRIIVPAIRFNDAENENSAFYMGLDYGSTNPTSLHVYRVKQPSRGIFHVMSVWEYFEPSDIPRIAAAIKGCPYYSLVEEIFADPSMWFYNQNTAHGVTSLAYMLRDHYQVRITPGKRGDTFAREQLGEMWGNPDDIRFTISEECENQIRELGGLRFETQSAKIDQKKNAPERLVDKDNHCYAADTEILTRDGWKLFGELTPHTPVATWDQGKIAYEKPSEIVWQDYQGLMYEYTGAALNFCVTPNHKMWVADQISTIHRKSPIFTRVGIENLPAVSWVTQQGESQDEEIDLSDDLIAWWGIWLAEGCKSQNYRGSFYAHIDQKKIDSEFENLMQRCSVGHRKVSKQGVIRYTFNKKYYDFVQEQGVAQDKYVPNFLKYASPRQLKILIKWMMRGDGTISKKMWRYNTVSKRLADDFQEVCFKAGYVTTITVQPERLSKLPNGKTCIGRPMYHINRRRGRHGQRGIGDASILSQINKKKLQPVIYHGKIGCVVTTSGTIVVRRNGKIMWCSNSWDDLKYFYNSRFTGPIANLSSSPTPLGIQAMNQDLANLKQQKLEKLNRAPMRKRRIFGY